MRRALIIFADFTWKQVQSCTFPFCLIGLLGLTRLTSGLPLPRYDLLLIGCLVIQWGMLWAKLESWRDVAVVTIFHALGLALEIHKINTGCWSYPEFSYLKIGGAPLYSGFMYAGVASYICLAWKRFDLRVEEWPAAVFILPLAALTYLQFFVGSWTLPGRLMMLALVLATFYRCRVYFTSGGQRLWMPMPVAFALIGSMIWIAENIATFLHAWQYPYQAHGWVPVHATKMVSWTLLIAVSVVVVEHAHRHLRLPARTLPSAVHS